MLSVNAIKSFVLNCSTIQVFQSFRNRLCPEFGRQALESVSRSLWITNLCMLKSLGEVPQGTLDFRGGSSLFSLITNTVSLELLFPLTRSDIGKKVVLRGDWGSVSGVEGWSLDRWSAEEALGELILLGLRGGTELVWLSSWTRLSLISSSGVCCSEFSVMFNDNVESDIWQSTVKLKNKTTVEQEEGRQRTKLFKCYCGWEITYARKQWIQPVRLEIKRLACWTKENAALRDALHGMLKCRSGCGQNNSTDLKKCTSADSEGMNRAPDGNRRKRDIIVGSGDC